MKVLFLLFTSVIVFHSCKIGEEVSVIDDKNSTSPQLVFLNYSIAKSDDAVVVKLINKIITEGKLKTNADEDYEYQEGDLRCDQLDANGMILQSSNVSNPLRNIVEYADGTGHLATKEIWVDSAFFSVRMQLASKTRTISVVEVKSEEDILQYNSIDIK